jgi:hypothetical protein
MRILESKTKNFQQPCCLLFIHHPTDHHWFGLHPNRKRTENDKLEFFFLGANEVNVVWLFLFVYIDLFIYLFGLT